MRITEIKTQQQKVDELKKFAEWAIGELGIDVPPSIKYGSDITQVKKRRTYGSTRSDGHIWVYVGDRSPADVMRTLAHELVHHKQFQQGSAFDGMDEEQTQKIEDEANYQAGRMMRVYGKMDDSIYESRASCLELKKQLLTSKKTDYNSIDGIMKKIAKKYRITPDQLHDYWVSDFKKTPDEWIKKQLTKKQVNSDSLIKEALSEYGIKGASHV
jgi:Zn-dependent peptidase ImmA (M78 family)